MLDKLINSTHPVITLLVLVTLQLVIGKKASFPYGIVFGYDPINIGIIITVCDVFIIFFVMFVFEGSSKIRYIRRLREKYTAKSDNWKEKRFFRYFNKLGRIGIVMVVIFPFTGGVWTAYLLANLLCLQKTETFSLSLLGAILGNFLFVLSSLGIIRWVI